MRLRHRYLMVGIAWALVLGPAACLSIFGFAAGASWLWLFGDDPWPEATQWVLPLIGLLAGVVAAVTCIVVANSYGRRREGLLVRETLRERRRILALALAPLFLLLVVGVMVWREGQRYADAMNAAVEREAAFAALVAATHRIEEIALERSVDGVFRAAVQVAGGREGEYRLRWRVLDTGFRSVLLTGDRLVRLGSGGREVVVGFTLDELARRYRYTVLKGDGGILVEEPFQLEVAVEPVLGELGRAALPPGERRRLVRGESPLRSVKDRRFPVRFTVHSDGTIGE